MFLWLENQGTYGELWGQHAIATIFYTEFELNMPFWVGFSHHLHELYAIFDGASPAPRGKLHVDCQGSTGSLVSCTVTSLLVLISCWSIVKV